MKKKFMTVALVFSLVSGVVGQKKYQRPAVNTPDSFRGADGTGSTEPTSIGDLKWFEVFQDEELLRLVRTAMVQNYDLRLAVARINAARANVGLARSGQFPQFEAGADLTTTRTSAIVSVVWQNRDKIFIRIRVRWPYSVHCENPLNYILLQ